MSACISGNLQLVQYAAEAIGIDVNLKNKVTYIFIVSCDNSNVLFQAGVTALSKACTFGHKLIVQYLISEYNADLFASNAFLASMRMMRLPIAEYLVTDCKVDPRKPLLVCHFIAPTLLCLILMSFHREEQQHVIYLLKSNMLLQYYGCLIEVTYQLTIKTKR